MDDETFLARFSAIASLLPCAGDYSRYDPLCALYLNATPEQRVQLVEMIAPEWNIEFQIRTSDWVALRQGSLDILGELMLYMRWVSERIKNKSDHNLIRSGLAAAAISEQRLDSRDTLVSLAFLYCAAKQAGIDPAPYFKEISQLARPATRKFIADFLQRDEAEIVGLYRAFSSPIDPK